MNPADVYLQRDASDLARIAYGMTLSDICRRLHAEKRAWIASVLLGRGWNHAAVARTLAYQHSSSMTCSLHLVRAS